MNLINKYRKLTFWNKIGFWGSLASLCGLLFSIYTLSDDVIKTDSINIENNNTISSVDGAVIITQTKNIDNSINTYQQKRLDRNIFIPDDFLLTHKVGMNLSHFIDSLGSPSSHSKYSERNHYTFRTKDVIIYATSIKGKIVSYSFYPSNVKTSGRFIIEGVNFWPRTPDQPLDDILPEYFSEYAPSPPTFGTAKIADIIPFGSYLTDGGYNGGNALCSTSYSETINCDYGACGSTGVTFEVGYVDPGSCNEPYLYLNAVFALDEIPRDGVSEAGNKLLFNYFKFDL